MLREGLPQPDDVEHEEIGTSTDSRKPDWLIKKNLVFHGGVEGTTDIVSESPPSGLSSVLKAN
jgi:hypothetical protein